MRKKIKKIICILSAVVIAFSCFSVSAAETKDYTAEQFFDSIGEVFVIVVSQLDGSETLIAPDSVEIEKDTIFYTFKTDSDNPFFSTDFFTCFAYLHSSDFSDDDYGVAYFLPKNISCDVEMSQVSMGQQNILYFPEYDFYASPFPLSECPCLILNSSPTVTEFTIAIRFGVAENLTSSRPLVDNRSFFSDIKTFLGSSINWVVQIFKNLTKNPPTFVLVVCFAVVGFVYALLYKFIGYKR